MIETHLKYGLVEVIILAIAGLLIFALFLWKIIRPSGIDSKGLFNKKCPVFVALIIALLLISYPVLKAGYNPDFKCEMLGFSSHWHFIVSLFKGGNNSHSVEGRIIPRAGERSLGENELKEKMPNIVIIFLESVPYSATSMGNHDLNTTPFLSELAAKGIHFQQTRSPVSHTTKALWSVLTSTTPDLYGDYVEAVPEDEAYESLATILKRAGYRSGFFEMSRGSFECAPGLFMNLGFDWAWFRENLEDRSAHIGYLGGDDFRMIDPALDWAKAGKGPFLLTMITSISHDPYIVPDWFDKPEDSLYRRFLQTLRYTDQFLKTFLEQLNSRGLAENTILCILGDHGTSFGSDPDLARWNPTEQILRIPWVINWPGYIEEGLTVKWPCSQLDVTPTLLKMLGYDISNAGFEGKDALTEPPDKYPQYFSSWYEQSPMAIIEGNRKCVYWPYLDKVMEYDLSSDPLEKSPTSLQGKPKQNIIDDILKWQTDSRIYMDPKRHRNISLYSHWQTFSSGRFAWAYYVP